MADPITPKQTDYINSLLKWREVPSDIAALCAKVSSKLEASMLIDRMVKLPWKPKAAAPAPARDEAYFKALNAAQVSKYAVPVKFLHGAWPEYAATLRGDLLFLEVRTLAGGRKVFARLSGAPGHFNRFRVPTNVRTDLLNFIHGRHAEFAKLFADHYKVCGKCAAELTDPDSRARGFGPDCARQFGLL